MATKNIPTKTSKHSTRSFVEAISPRLKHFHLPSFVWRPANLLNSLLAHDSIGGSNKPVLGGAGKDPKRLIANSVLASMGPRTYIRGNVKMQQGGLVDQSAFNGAADLHPRKRGENDNQWICWNPLQWGRGLTSAETADS